jgi:hypothetical protein
VLSTSAIVSTEELPPDSLEPRASRVLKVLAAIHIAGVIFASIPGTEPASLLHTVAFNTVSAAMAVLYLLVARGLDRRARWAVTAVRPLMVLLLAWGTYAFVAALLAGALRIPVTPVAAGLALYGASDLWPLPRPSAAGAAAVMAMAGLVALALASQPLFGWGGLLDVHEQDLHATLSVDCGDPGALPDRISVAYDWTWSSGTLLANDEDAVVFGWTGNDAAGRPLYLLGHVPDFGPGLRIGMPAGPSAAMAREVAERWRGLVGFRLDLVKVGFRPGRVEFQLRGRPGLSPPASLTIAATYIHVGVWQKVTPPVNCSW